jgi:hypothetical protein
MFYQTIQTDFADTGKTRTVWPREFDSQGISVLDVETHLDNMGLGQEVNRAISNRVKLDRSTENLLAFNAGGAGSPPPPKATLNPATSPSEKFGKKH